MAHLRATAVTTYRRARAVAPFTAYALGTIGAMAYIGSQLITLVRT